MGVEAIPHGMAIPTLLISAVIVIGLATWLLDMLFPASRKPPGPSDPS